MKRSRFLETLGRIGRLSTKILPVVIVSLTLSLAFAGLATADCDLQLVGSVDTYGSTASGIAISGTLAYLTDLLTGSFFVIDVSNPASPAVLTRTSMPGRPRHIALSGTLACVAANGFSTVPGNLSVFDVSNPASPVLLGTVYTNGWANDVAIYGTMAYVTAGSFHVIDISNPSSPAIVTTLPIVGGAVEISGTKAYLAVASTGLIVVDISNPAAPVILGSVATPGQASDVAVSGTMAFVADYYSLQVIDVSNPTSPQIKGSVAIPGSANGIAMSGSIAYVCVGTSGLLAVDVSNPLSPTIVDNQDTPDRPLDIAVSGSMVYVADYGSGLQIIAQCSGTTGIDETAPPPLYLKASPNPFASAVDLHFDLEHADHVRVTIVDLQGRIVGDLVGADFPPGSHQVTWTSSDERHPVAPGIYFAHLVTANGHSQVQKLFKTR